MHVSDAAGQCDRSAHSLAHHLLQYGHDRLGPDLVPLLAGVRRVGHHLLGEMALLVEELRPDVHERDVLDAFEQSGQVGVQLDDLLAVRVGQFTSPREDAEDQDVHLGILLVQFLGNGLDAVRGFSRLVAAPADVVRADHDDGGLGRFLELGQVVQPPQDVVCPVPAESKIDRLERLEVLLPDSQADFLVLEIVRDRVADHQQIDVALAHQADLLGLAGEPPLGDAGQGRDGRALLRGGFLCSLDLRDERNRDPCRNSQQGQ